MIKVPDETLPFLAGGSTRRLVKPAGHDTVDVPIGYQRGPDQEGIMARGVG